MGAQLTFFGGADTVTGSKSLLEYRNRKILVDCGMFQGLKQLRLKNWEPSGIPVSQLDGILLTHAHLDHCGYLPVLVKEGFRGPIHCTGPTKELVEIILKDSAKIQEEEAERANRYGYTIHHPARPLYDLDDVMDCLPLMIPHEYHQWLELGEGIRIQFLNAGHILGSAMIEARMNGQSILFTGDLGTQHPLLLPPPEKVDVADTIVLESTYGDRQHTDGDAKSALQKIIWETYEKDGDLIIPTFAVERAQELLFLLSVLKVENKLPDVPIYLDSPMGVSATAVMLHANEWHMLSHAQIQAMDRVAKLIVDVQSSKKAVADPRPKIVLAGSGMITGGRVLHYLDKGLADPCNTILLVGYQAEGTRGRTLENGAQDLKFFGSYHPVRATIRKMDYLSGHADQRDIMDWLRQFKHPPKNVLINHGEPHASDALRAKIHHELGWNCEVAHMHQTYQII